VLVENTLADSDCLKAALTKVPSFDSGELIRLLARGQRPG
jgi:hypothetical protein